MNYLDQYSGIKSEDTGIDLQLLTKNRQGNFDGIKTRPQFISKLILIEEMNKLMHTLNNLPPDISFGLGRKFFINCI